MIVVVMVAAGDAADPTSVAMIQTTKRALDPGATVLTIETQATPTDASAESIASAQRADAIVVVSWSANHEHARVRVRSASGTWTEREVDFNAADAPEERGRALGLVASTMVPATPPPTTTTNPSATQQQPVAKPTPTPAPIPERRGVIAVGVVFAGGLDRPGISLGPSVVGSYRLAWWIWAHVSADVRFGGWDPAKATAVWLAFAPGVGIRVPLARDVRAGFRVHVGGLGTWLAAGPVTGGRATAGMIGLGEITWQPGRFGVGVGFGVEAPFEKTNVFTNGASVGNLPLLRLRSEVAMTVAF